MKGIVVYKSKYGATEQYAQMIGAALNFTLKNANEISYEQLENYDIVIAGSSIYIGKILLKDWLKKNEAVLLKKKVALFIVGGEPVSEKEKTQKYFTDNVSMQLLSKCKTFYLHGRTIYKNLTLFDKFLLSMGARLAGNKRSKKEMLTDFDDVKKENLAALLQNFKQG